MIVLIKLKESFFLFPLKFHYLHPRNVSDINLQHLSFFGGTHPLHRTLINRARFRVPTPPTADYRLLRFRILINILQPGLILGLFLGSNLLSPNVQRRSQSHHFIPSKELLLDHQEGPGKGGTLGASAAFD